VQSTFPNAVRTSRRGPRPRPSKALALLLTVACAAPASAPEPTAAHEASVAPGANAPFLAPDVDVAHYEGVFEGESREIAVARDAIVAALELRPGESVADVGAGTGLFLEPLARGVGTTGRVFAIDIAPAFVRRLAERAEAEGFTQVEALLGRDDGLDLPAASLDLVFVCDTYHHFEYPRAMLAGIRRALRPGGRLVIVDLERVPGVSRDWILDHVRMDEQTCVAEVEAEGFVLERAVDLLELEENYVLRFRRP
jgi:SAM-dependent methyltransferase